MRQAYIVSYDVSHPKRLRRVFRIMKGYGDHLQLSVFRCELNDRELVEVRAKLGEVINHDEDQVLFMHALQSEPEEDATALVAMHRSVTLVDLTTRQGDRVYVKAVLSQKHACLMLAGDRRLGTMTARTMFTPTDFSPYPWMEFAHRELGTARFPGHRSNPRIQEYLSAAGLTGVSEDTAWCSAFVNWALAQVGIRGTHRANARSWLSWDGLCLGKPYYGTIVVLSRAPNPAHGHVSFYVGEEQGQLVLLGGNQAADSSVCLSTYNRTRVLGYRWPPGFEVPR